ncbi:hypothetical protein ABEB36_002147 [Hypothenemus hampei]|uniref:Uncharacterized protein n=1 Tax=Hypothenemus hampei TaxID=57062 RepID=A0ABD1F4S4_HYPHA
MSWIWINKRKEALLTPFAMASTISILKAINRPPKRIQSIKYIIYQPWISLDIKAHNPLRHWIKVTHFGTKSVFYRFYDFVIKPPLATYYRIPHTFRSFGRRLFCEFVENRRQKQRGRGNGGWIPSTREEEETQTHPDPRRRDEQRSMQPAKNSPAFLFVDATTLFIIIHMIDSLIREKKPSALIINIEPHRTRRRQLVPIPLCFAERRCLCDGW